MNTKSAFVAIVGRPNVGKSSLLNALVGEKVAIVSPKAQTTRNRITGILTLEETQLVFIDTPGAHSPKTKLSEYMVKEIEQSVADVDLALLLTEPTGEITAVEAGLIESLRARKIPAILVINKIDLLARKEEMMPKIKDFTEKFPFAEAMPISVLKKDGLNLLMDKIKKYAKPSPHFFADDDYTDQPERVIVGEIIREKLLQNLHDELPHGIAVAIEEMKERENGDIIDISANIYCEKDSHKGMIIGKQGAMLKKIASQSRVDIERFLDVHINLQCWVKVKEDWRNREGLIREFGFK